MNIRLTPNELKLMVLARASEIEADWKRHQAAQREIPQVSPFAGLGSAGDDQALDAKLEAEREVTYRAQNELQTASMSDSLARQVQWMRKMADHFGAQQSPIECSLEDLVRLNLWPAAPHVSARVFSVL